MVGYIDDAVVGSQIRVRLDLGFDNNFPDRAEFFYPQCGCEGGTAKGPAPGLVSNLNFQQLYMRGEYAPVKRLSFFVEVPWRWLQPEQFVAITIPNGGVTPGSGLSDVQAGIKFALVASPERYLTFQTVASFPTGDSTTGLGTAHYTFAPSLLFFQKVTDRFSVEAQLGDSHPIDTDTPGFAGDVLMYGIGPSYELYRGERVRFVPVLELVAWSVLSGKESNGNALITTGDPVVNVGGTNIVNLKAGARTTIGRHNSFYLGYGQALTHEVWYKHLIRLEYRYTF